MNHASKSKFYAERAADIVCEAMRHFRNTNSSLMETARPILFQVVGEIAPCISGMGNAASVVDEILAFRYPNYISQTYLRSNLESKSEMNRYKQNYLKSEPGRINHTDEVTGVRNMTGNKKDSDKRRTTDVKFKHNAETDHIVSLKEIFNTYGHNIALSDSELKSIANKETNFALTINGVNNIKGDMSYKEWLDANDHNRELGKYYVPINKYQRKRILKMDREARMSLERAANRAVLKTLTGGNGIARIKDVTGERLSMVGRRKLNEFIGYLAIALLKPTYYELHDLALNGMRRKLLEDIRLRIGRISLYVREEAVRLAKGLVSWETAFSLVREAINSIAELFYGFYKHIISLLSRGVETAVHVWKQCHDSDNAMTRSQKVDEAIKDLGKLVIDTCGLGMEQAMLQLKMPVKAAKAISAVVSGSGTIMLFHTIDTHDILGYKEQEATNEVRAIFERNIRDLMKIELAYLGLEFNIKFFEYKLTTNHRGLMQALYKNDYNSAIDLVEKRAEHMGLILDDSIEKIVRKTEKRGLPA